MPRPWRSASDPADPHRGRRARAAGADHQGQHVPRGRQLAERFSDGRVHLVGDAAHRVTPRGGNGLAMAVRDGLALGWRLAWVLRGSAPPCFLGGYEQEQRPLAAADVARAADPQGGCDAVITEMLNDVGGRLQHAWVGPGTSTLDLVGQGVTLLVADDLDGGAGPRPRCCTRSRSRWPSSARDQPRPRAAPPRWRRPGPSRRRTGRPLVALRRPGRHLDRAVTDLLGLGADVSSLQEIA